MRTRTRLSVSFTFVAVILVAVLLSCTNNTQNNNGGSTDASDRVKLVLDWRPGAEHAFLSLAKQRKTFEAQGISVDVIPGGGSSKAASQVDAGAAEFGLCAGETALQAFAKGKHIAALAIFYPNTPATILSLADKNIKRPEDLYGKRLGYIQGSSAFKNYQAFAAKAGLDRKQITEIAIAGKAEELTVPNALIDATVEFSYQYPLQLKLKGIPVNEIPFRDYDVKVYGLGLIVSSDLLQKNPKLVERMTRAVVEAYRYALEHEDDALSAFLQEYKDQDPEYSKAKFVWVKNFVMRDTGSLQDVGKHDQEGWQATADYLRETNQVDKSVDNLADFYVTKYVP
ncbi:MAG TPA: ABC transporter substrate-binding protein [Blastocatellia bacterium]|jgi:NitT/TauT family transport system substrate-binding protein|nr:ABC transporter substrate-binding protein [Blastocatellia bacterium]